MMLGLAAVVLAFGALQTTLAAVAVTRHRAAGVADLAALAGAEQVRAGAACAEAERVAAAGAATLLSCVLDGAEVQVVVEVRPLGPLGELGAARGRARAGPGPSRIAA
jgi:secretion/DNA translocation related TadE-like protein